MSAMVIPNLTLWTADEVERNKSVETALGLVSQELIRLRLPGDDGTSLFRGNAHMLGYYAGGMLMVPFVQWLIQAAKEGGIEDLYFLARDGHIIKRIFEILAPYYGDVPKSHYLLASRRAFNNASIRCEDDILESLEDAFLTGSPKSILQSRFGVAWSSESDEACLAAGFKNGDSLCDYENDEVRAKLKVFLLAQQVAIFSQSKNERTALGEYLDQTMSVGRKSAVVDIGHSGSLQKSLLRLAGDANIGGFYFLTFNKASLVHTASTPVRGWLAEFIDPSRECIDYCRNIGMFEFLFLNEEESLSHFEFDEASGSAAPVYVGEPVGDRQKQVSLVHGGIDKFTRDLVDCLGAELVGFCLERDVATRAMMEFVRNPSRADAEIVSNVLFFDGYAGGATHHLVQPNRVEALQSLSNFGDYIDKSWWKPGALSLLIQDKGSESRVRRLSRLWAGLPGRLVRRLRRIRGLL